MNRPRTTLRECRDKTTAAGLRAAYSLHAHTNYSRESMADVSQYLNRLPIIGGIVRREIAAYEHRNRARGEVIDFSKVWWRPPVDPAAVLDSEREHAAQELGLDAIVSITDHDTIEGALDLQRQRRDATIPISLEWSVPFEHGLFHLGVHNLAPRFAPTMAGDLNAYTRSRDDSMLGPILEALTTFPATLLVLNHPLWDLAGVGADVHVHLLRRFLNRFGDRVHAFELNGYRSRLENSAVRTLAEHYPLPLVSGGDRHGCDPNALVNLSGAGSFAEFVEEIRVDRRSVIAVLRPYRRSLVGRKLSTASDAMREQQSSAGGRSRWTDRVEFEDRGVTRSLSEEWPNGGPWWVRATMGTFRFGALPLIQPAMRAVVWMADASRSHDPVPAAGLTPFSASEVSGESI